MAVFTFVAAETPRLGASGFYTFRRVYFPLSLHGVLSGALIVYILMPPRALGSVAHQAAE